jgi:hypothetical protein
VALGYAGASREASTRDPALFRRDEMARKSLGAPHWKAARPDAQQRYLETFERFMVANYAGPLRRILRAVVRDARRGTRPRATP